MDTGLLSLAPPVPAPAAARRILWRANIWQRFHSLSATQHGAVAQWDHRQHIWA
uniref:hypothetical protein n=1 Tax=Phaeobacter sp. BS34 TaxID=2907240 RepID=UPI00370486DE